MDNKTFIYQSPLSASQKQESAFEVKLLYNGILRKVLCGINQLWPDDRNVIYERRNN